MLLLGSDDDAKFPPDRVNTQSMILIRVDPGTKQATMLSIPRDLWVPIPGQGMGKISTAYQPGGVAGAIAAVESNFKVHIDDLRTLRVQNRPVCRKATEYKQEAGRYLIEAPAGRARAPRHPENHV